MEQVAQNAQGGLGNTTTKPPIDEKKKRHRRWCLTINNYTAKIETDFDTNVHDFTKWICGREVGLENTKHLQCYVEWKNGVTFNSMKKKFPKSHIEVARSSIKKNYTYCSKEGNFTTNIDMRTFRDKLMEKVLEEEYGDIKWKPWQKKVIDILAEKPDKRTIHWFFERKGNTGKSFLSRYIAIKNKGVIICEGKKGDIFNQVNVMLETNVIPQIIICDIPRTYKDSINYGALEQLKNGMLYSGKYEGGMCIFPPPHVVCFSNERPDKTSLSKDRWNVIKI